MSYKKKLGLILFSIGLLGVLSMLTVTIPLDKLPKEVLEKFSPEGLKWLVLVNPTILLLITTIIGTLLFDKVALTVPTITSFLKSEKSQTSIVEQLKFGIILGLLTGFIISIITIIFKILIPHEFLALNNKVTITPIARLAYGGFTEEILLRYGVMTLMVWIIFKITKRLNNLTYWLGILIASLLFALGHFPVAFSAVTNPSMYLLTYILIGNSIAGIIFGWIYWKKGLESAFVAHIFAHILMILLESFIK